jgi:hypothetical protein
MSVFSVTVDPSLRFFVEARGLVNFEFITNGSMLKDVGTFTFIICYLGGDTGLKLPADPFTLGRITLEQIVLLSVLIRNLLKLTYFNAAKLFILLISSFFFSIPN